MSIVLQGSTSGSITLQEPAVAGSTVLTLPAATGTILTTASSGQIIPKAALPTGSVLQVVYASYTTQVSSTSTSYVDTGLSASITPTSSSSKILVLVNQYIYMWDTSSPVDVSIGLQIVRGSTAIFTPNTKEQFYFYVPSGISRGDVATNLPLQYLDSPATTSSTTYKIQGALSKSDGNQNTLYQGSSNPSTITLMEIAA